jgi:hypothetical protein
LEAWPPWRISSAQIFRGMSIRRPQPSPSPSTLPARCSIFSSATSAASIGSWLGLAFFATEA